MTFETPPFLTTGPFSFTPLPSIAMLWSIEDLFGESISRLPAGACARAELVGEGAGGVGGDLELAVLGLGGLVGLLDPDGRERARVLAGLGDRAGDVGRDVLRVLALVDPGRHQGAPACRSWDRLGAASRVEDLALDDALERALAEAVPARCWKASSRFGPVTPVVPARLSMWQEPHLATNAFLPATRLSPSSLSSQPDRRHEQRGSGGDSDFPSPHGRGIVSGSGSVGRPSRASGPARPPAASARRRPTSSARA